MNIAVVGTGYVGLVTGTCFAETGNTVKCVDIDEKKVARMRNGEVPIFEPGLDLLFERNTKQGRLTFTTNLAEAIEDAEDGGSLGELHTRDRSCPCRLDLTWSHRVVPACETHGRESKPQIRQSIGKSSNKNT